MEINIIYGIKGLSDSTRGVIRSELHSRGCDVVNDSTVREIKTGIDQEVANYVSPLPLVLIISQAMDSNNPFQINDLLRYQKQAKDIRILMIVNSGEKGGNILREMSNNGMYLALYEEDTSPQIIGNLIVNGRNIMEAKKYYGVSNAVDTAKALTVDSAVEHMTQPVKSPKEYLERAGWIRKTFGSDDVFAGFVKKLPNQIKDILADSKTYYPFVEDYVLSKSSSGIRMTEVKPKEKRKLFGKNRDKEHEAELERQHERLEQEAEKALALERERERIEAKILAEKAAAEADKEKRAAEEAERAEKERLAKEEAERAAEERRIKEEEKARREAEKQAERERAAEEKARKAEEEAEKRRELKEMQDEAAFRNKIMAEMKAKEDAERKEKLRIEAAANAEAKAKADLEFRRSEAERRERERAAIRAEKEKREESFFLSAGDVKNVVKGAIRRTIIGVAGAQKHVGCTHQSLLIAHSLSAMGFGVAIVEDCNQTDKVFDVIAEENGKTSGDIFTFNGVDYYPCFALNQLPSLNVKNYNFVIVDFGLYEERMVEEYGRCSLQVLVSGSRAWETKQLERIFSSVTEDQLMVYNYLFLGTPEVRKSVMKRDMQPLKNVFFGEYAPNPYASEGYQAIREILNDFIVAESDEVTKKKSGGLLGKFRK